MTFFLPIALLILGGIVLIHDQLVKSEREKQRQRQMFSVIRTWLSFYGRCSTKGAANYRIAALQHQQHILDMIDLAAAGKTPWEDVLVTQELEDAISGRAFSSRPSFDGMMAMYHDAIKRLDVQVSPVEFGALVIVTLDGVLMSETVHAR